MKKITNILLILIVMFLLAGSIHEILFGTKNVTGSIALALVLLGVITEFKCILLGDIVTYKEDEVTIIGVIMKKRKNLPPNT